MENEIKNRCAGKWQSFDEYIDPVDVSNGTKIAVWSEERQWCMVYRLVDGLWISHVIGEMSANECDLRAKYDAFCVIRGPWEDKDAGL